MKQLKYHINKQFKNLSKNLENYHHLQDPSVVHNIRVEIKKLKAALNLINYCVKKFKAHQHFIPLRTIFRKAGAIRQPNVLYQLLLKYEVDGVNDQQIPASDKLEKLSKAFQNKVPEFIEVAKIQRKRVEPYIDQVSKSDAELYSKKNRRELKKLLYPKFNKNGLHKARKVCKEVVYLHWIEGKTKHDQFYREIDSLIGRWHDKQMLLQVVRKGKVMDEISRLNAACRADLVDLKQLVSNHYIN